MKNKFLDLTMTKEDLLLIKPEFLAYEEEYKRFFNVEIPEEILQNAKDADIKKELYRNTFIDNVKGDEKSNFWKNYYSMPNGNSIIEDYIKSQVNFPKSELVDQVGGGEGEGEYCHWVRFYPELNLYLKIEANYYSYDGVEFDYAQVYEVEPKEVVVTQYYKK